MRIRLPLPNIQSLGDVILESSQEIANVCNTLQDATASDGSTLVIKGTLTCNGKKLTPGQGDTSNDSSSGSGGGLSSGAQIGIGIGIGGAALIVIALLLAFFIRKRRASKKAWPEVSAVRPQSGGYAHSTTPELPSYPAEKRAGVSSSAVERHELEQPAPPTELPTNRSPSPLQMGHISSSRFREIESP